VGSARVLRTSTVAPPLLNTVWNAPGGAGSLKRNQEMVQALHATGHTGELVELLGKDHFMASSDIGVNDDPSTPAIHNFLGNSGGCSRGRLLRRQSHHDEAHQGCHCRPRSCGVGDLASRRAPEWHALRPNSAAADRPPLSDWRPASSQSPISRIEP
jgi:hypothetical protein